MRLGRRHGIGRQRSLLRRNGVGFFSVSLAAISVPSMFDSASEGTDLFNNIWWMMFWAAVPIYILTIGLLVYALVRSRRRDANIDPQEIRYSSLLVGGGVVLPVLVIIPLTITTVLVGTELTSGDEDESLAVEITGHQWWWEINYPEAGVTTANELHIPIDRPVQLQLTSADVIHSFWVPQLQGKIDLIPGKTNTLWLEPEEPGTFRGMCAEFCGVQHANMRFLAVSHEPEEFESWLEQQQQPAVEPDGELAREGREVFEESPCATCHYIEGVNEDAPVEMEAPDLTHVGSRQEIAAGALENTRGNMGGWILDPQNIKPGNKMHATNLDAEELHALLTYLESLE